MRLLLIPFLVLSLSLSVMAIGVDKDRLADPVLEARAQNVMKQLRCLVCQNQSIVESDAGLAEDLRAIVRELVSAGKTDAEILDFMTSRYGDWVLLNPPFKASTALLWLAPGLLVLGGGILVFRFVRRRPEQDALDPLSAEERQRLKKIMGEDS